MSGADDDLDIIEHLSAGNGLRLNSRLAEGHVRSDPEMKALLEDTQRRYRVMHGRLKDENDGPDAA